MRSTEAERHTVQREPFEIRPLCAAFGAELTGVDLCQSVDDHVYAAIRTAFLKHQLLLFRDQDLPPASHVALGRSFGQVQVHVMDQYHADGFPELYFLSNPDENGKPSGQHPDKGTLAWHTDGSWRRGVTGQATMLYAVEVPPVDHPVIRTHPETGRRCVRCLMHRATPYDAECERRVMRRCTILGEVPH